MDLTPAAKLVLALLLGPVAAAYDFVTNPNAPPAIFVTQFNEAFPKIPPPVVPRPPRPKHVYVTHS